MPDTAEAPKRRSTPFDEWTVVKRQTGEYFQVPKRHWHFKGTGGEGYLVGAVEYTAEEYKAEFGA